MAKEITKEELRKSVHHWWEIRFWAKHREQTKKAWVAGIPWAIYPDATNCILCKRYLKEIDRNEHYRYTCRKCPLHKAGYQCMDNKNSPYQKVMRSETWGEFVINATEMARVLMRLPRQK